METEASRGRSASCWVVVFCLGIGSQAALAAGSESQQCHYDYKIWNTRLNRVIEKVSVDKPRSELTPLEIGPYGCTPCVEDQEAIRLKNGLTVVLCTKIADRVRDALNEALDDGAVIDSIGGYRAAKTRGRIDAKGNRTEYTYHSYGVALDINPGNNGFYMNCRTWGPQCKLYTGGPWKPNSSKKSFQDGDLVVTALESIGLRWGGRMKGHLKDFMHFSPLGY